MAYSASLSKVTVFGDQRIAHYVVTADAATGAFSSHVGTINQVMWCPKSMTTANSVAYVRVRANQLAGTTASVGSVGFSGLVSGDELYVTVYGT